MRKIVLTAALAAWLSLTAVFQPLAAQSVLPGEPMPLPRDSGLVVEALELKADIDGQKAKITLNQTVRNTGRGPLEFDFLVPLPFGGAVSGLVASVDGQELVGQIHGREEALAVYRSIVEQMRDPALLEYAGRDLYRARIFPIPPGRASTLTLSAELLVPKNDGRLDFIWPLAGPLTQGRTPERQSVVVNLRGRKIGGVYTPLSEAKVTALSPEAARVELTADHAPALPAFQLHWREDSGKMGGLVLSHKPEQGEDGFFLFLAEPAFATEVKQIPKSVIFVLDRSGSMEGHKFAQAKGALEFVLERLAPEDSFGLVDFSGEASLWRPELEAMTPAAKASAVQYVKNLRAGGGTNIGAALTAGFKLAAAGRPTYALLLTDGEPTEGLTDELPLAAAAASANSLGARVFAFGVGHGVNARLLTRLASQASGTAIFVAPEASIEEKVSAFFAKLVNPALVRPQLTASRTVNRLEPSTLPDVFFGGQTVVVGRYPQGGPTVFTLRGQEDGQEAIHAHRTTLAEGPSEGGDFVARLWAQRRIGAILEQIDLRGENPELVAELVGLSKKYGVMTPYTSFLALEGEALTDGAALQDRASRN
ncbi:MAG: VIT and VWA domain-containing protein, partial [Deltaproteobacteria bacterium]|nr:VIT and VWA domain-containing protein [Deltaproteobacteria bacterium]